MARYYVAFDTMKQFMKVTGTETLSELVSQGPLYWVHTNKTLLKYQNLSNLVSGWDNIEGEGVQWRPAESQWEENPEHDEQG